MFTLAATVNSLAVVRSGFSRIFVSPDRRNTFALVAALHREIPGVREIAAELSLPLELVRDVALKVDRNEYKRQQAAPGLKVTSKAFGIGRRFPIAQKYVENE